MVESGVGTLYLVSNYSTPVQVTALVHVGPSPYSTTAMVFDGVMFLVGIAGMVLTIMGAVSRPKRRQ